jgi:hypothetical protein
MTDRFPARPDDGEPRRGRPIKAFGRESLGLSAGVGLSLSNQTKDAAGEDSRQLLATLDGGQVGRRGYGGCRHGSAAPEGFLNSRRTRVAY